MKKKTEQAYQEWIEEQTAKLPTELQANFKQLVDSPQGVEIFGGYMREQEFHRRLNELDGQRKTFEQDRQTLESNRQILANDVAKLQKWYQDESPKYNSLAKEHEALRREKAALSAQLAEFGVDPVVPAPPGGPSVKQTNDELRGEIAQLRAQYAAMDAAFPAVLKDLATVLTRASKEKFDIDPDALIDHATKQTNNLVKSYEELTLPERTKRRDEEVAKQIEDARKEGERAALSKVHSPERLRPSGPSIFDQINGAPSDSRGRVSSAVEAYNSMMTEKLG